MSSVKSDMIFNSEQQSLIMATGTGCRYPVQPHTFMETDHEIFSMAIFLLQLIQEWRLLVTAS